MSQPVATGQMDVVYDGVAEEKPQCEVCLKLVELFQRWKPKHTQWQRMELGTLQEILSYDTCLVHPPIFRKFFRDAAETSGELRIDGRCRHDGTVNLKGCLATRSWTTSLSLLSTPSDSDGRQYSKPVDPEWIDHTLLRQWKAACDEKRCSDCQQDMGRTRLSPACPQWLIDTSRMCVVRGIPGMDYVALSYVWGTGAFFKTSKATITELQKEHALDDAHVRLGVPRTITDAIAIVPLLDEKYLWVDALCIVQDDEVTRSAEINKMAAIYDSASLTIIANQGTDAEYGLRGIRNISQPRASRQVLASLPEGYEIAGISKDQRESYIWAQRGWTYQESTFSRRKLWFESDSVTWECGCTSFAEHFQGELQLHDRYRKRPFVPSILPPMRLYGELVEGFGTSNFTHPQDALSAFAGIMTALNASFTGGFVCGLPLMFLDMALCWYSSNGHISQKTRRLPSNNHEPTEMGLPSWSWVGWQSTVYSLYWLDAEKHVKRHWFPGCDLPSLYFVPLVDWSSMNWGASEVTPISHHQRAVYEMKRTPLEEGNEIPPGWTRFQCSPDPLRETADRRDADSAPGELRYYYKHESDAEAEYWHPIPTCCDNSPDSSASMINNDPLLSGRTRRACFQLRRSIYDDAVAYIYNNGGDWAGSMLWDIIPYEIKDLAFSQGVLPCDLVVISVGSFIEGQISIRSDIWDPDERRFKGKKGEKYEFYNVLWVEWKKGIAYRKGVGRVQKDVWDAGEEEWIDLVLG